MTDANLFEQWKNRVDENPLNAGANSRASKFWKPYFHFDIRIKKKDVSNWRDQLLSFDHVRKHSFYPFLKHEVIKKRFGDVEIQDGCGNIRTIRTRLKVKTKRPICYAAHKDALIYAWYSYKLHHLLENRIQSLNISECVLAYRSLDQRCNIHFAKEVFDFIKGRECVALAFDVKSFFDTLDHELLKGLWCELLGESRLPADHYTIFKSMTNFRFVHLDEFKNKIGTSVYESRSKIGKLTNPKEFREIVVPLIKTNTKKGIPQGSPLSAVLSNIYMIKADSIFSDFANQCGGYYRRYCDDLLMVVPSDWETEAYKIIKNTVEGDTLKLKLNINKTEIRHFKADTSPSKDEHGNNKPLQYLGLEFDGKHIRLRSASLSKYHHRLRRNIKRAGGMAFGKNTYSDGKIFKRTLYRKYTKLGKRNFIRYAEKAYEITQSEALRRQYQDCIQTVNECVKIETIRRQEVKSKSAKKHRVSSILNQQKP